VAIAQERLTSRRDVAHCAVCLVVATRSSHITSVIRQLRDRGWDIATSRCGCGVCGKPTTHYQVVGSRPSTQRVAIPAGLRKSYLESCRYRDAFTGAPSQKLEIDHRTPHKEETADEAPVDADTIAVRFQPLSASSNQLKRWACERCSSTGTRPAFMQIDFWVDGGSARPQSCEMCPWANPELWRTELHRRLG
jgi:hypothetical protein